MTTPHDRTPGSQDDPQTHLDTDPVNDDTQDDPAHDTSDEGWESEGGANPSGPAIDD